MSRKLKQI